jgi:uncharacterized protein DUF4231
MRASTASPYVADQYREVFQTLNLTDLQREYLDVRWLDQVVWHDLRATRADVRYLALRLTVLVGGATATAFASLKLSGATASWVSGLIFALTLTTTIAAGILELMKFDELARRSRATAENLKHEGWLFFQSTGPYHGDTHQGLFPLFAERIETILGNEFAPVGGAEIARKSMPLPPARSSSR